MDLREYAGKLEEKYGPAENFFSGRRLQLPEVPRCNSERWMHEMTTSLTALTGLKLDAEHIYAASKFSYYMNGFGHPRIMYHGKYQYWEIIIPDADASKLENGSITVSDYINQARWYLGLDNYPNNQYHYWLNVNLFDKSMIESHVKDLYKARSNDPVKAYLKAIVEKGKSAFNMQDVAIDLWDGESIYATPVYLPDKKAPRCIKIIVPRWQIIQLCDYPNMDYAIWLNEAERYLSFISKWITAQNGENAWRDTLNAIVAEIVGENAPEIILADETPSGSAFGFVYRTNNANTGKWYLVISKSAAEKLDEDSERLWGGMSSKQWYIAREYKGENTIYNCWHPIEHFYDKDTVRKQFAAVEANATESGSDIVGTVWNNVRDYVEAVKNWCATYLQISLGNVTLHDGMMVDLKPNEAKTWEAIRAAGIDLADADGEKAIIYRKLVVLDLFIPKHIIEALCKNPEATAMRMMSVTHINLNCLCWDTTHIVDKFQFELESKPGNRGVLYNYWLLGYCKHVVKELINKHNKFGKPNNSGKSGDFSKPNNSGKPNKKSWLDWICEIPKMLMHFWAK